MLSAFPAPIKFLEQFNLDFCAEKYSEYKTLEEALCSEKIKIRLLAKIYGDETVVTWMQSWLINISKYMDFTISDDQARKTAMFLAEELYMLNLAEITLFFKKLLKGVYGEFFGKFNGQIIMSGAMRYRQERGRIVSNMSTEQQDFINGK